MAGGTPHKSWWSNTGTERSAQDSSQFCCAQIGNRPSGLNPHQNDTTTDSISIKTLEDLQARRCPRHAVRIEPSLRLPSPKNGNISACGQRLLAISPLRWRNREAGDGSLNWKSPPLAGLST